MSKKYNLQCQEEVDLQSYTDYLVEDNFLIRCQKVRHHSGYHEYNSPEDECQEINIMWKARAE